MSLSLGIIFGIIAMVSWGTADFFVAKAVRKTTIFKTFFWSQLLGSILLLLASLFFGSSVPDLSFQEILIILISALIGAVSYLAFYKGLKVGKVSVVSPIAACWAAITIILSLIFLGESLTFIQGLGAFLAVLGVILVSFKFQDVSKSEIKNLFQGAEYGFIAMIGWGAFFVLVDIIVTKTGWFIGMFFLKSLLVFYLLIYSGLGKRNISFPRNVTLFIFSIGLLEAVASLAYGAGISSEYTSVVAPISAAFPMVTIVLARIFFREKLEANQKIGILSILAGLILLSL